MNHNDDIRKANMVAVQRTVHATKSKVNSQYTCHNIRHNLFVYFFLICVLSVVPKICTQRLSWQQKHRLHTVTISRP